MYLSLGLLFLFPTGPGSSSLFCSRVGTCEDHGQMDLPDLHVAVAADLSSSLDLFAQLGKSSAVPKREWPLACFEWSKRHFSQNMTHEERSQILTRLLTKEKRLPIWSFANGTENQGIASISQAYNKHITSFIFLIFLVFLWISYRFPMDFITSNQFLLDCQVCDDDAGGAAGAAGAVCAATGRISRSPGAAGAPQPLQPLVSGNGWKMMEMGGRTNLI